MCLVVSLTILRVIVLGHSEMSFAIKKYCRGRVNLFMFESTELN